MADASAPALDLRLGAAPKESPLASMHPAYFAVVMATGIVSIACQLLGFGWLAKGLFGLNLFLYPVLWVLTIARLVAHRDRIAADLLHHGRSVGFFTTVAATNVFGSQCLLIAASPRAASLRRASGIALRTRCSSASRCGLAAACCTSGSSR